MITKVRCKTKANSLQSWHKIKEWPNFMHKIYVPSLSSMFWPFIFLAKKVLHTREATEGEKEIFLPWLWVQLTFLQAWIYGYLVIYGTTHFTDDLHQCSHQVRDKGKKWLHVLSTSMLINASKTFIVLTWTSSALSSQKVAGCSVFISWSL